MFMSRSAAIAPPTHSLWFVNQSGSPGLACVYQDQHNAPSNLAVQTLAWMLTGANDGVWVRFDWALDYDFVWFDADSGSSQQVIAADPAGANNTTLSHNAFGFFLTDPQEGNQPGNLYIAQDGSVDGRALVGIGMHGAGTFARTSGPHQRLVFTPAAALSYWITFGQYTFAPNDPLALDSLDDPRSVTFPFDTFVMTATLSSDGTWKVSSGAPTDAGFRKGLFPPTTVYEAGRGVMSAAMAPPAEASG